LNGEGTDQFGASAAREHPRSASAGDQGNKWLTTKTLELQNQPLWRIPDGRHGVPSPSTRERVLLSRPDALPELNVDGSGVLV
jgi:hypothetical protein